MKKGRPDEAWFLDMKRAIELALDFTHGITREQFDANPMCQSAVIYQLAVLGEAAKKVSDEFQKSHPKGRTSEHFDPCVPRGRHGRDMENRRQ